MYMYSLSLQQKLKFLNSALIYKLNVLKRFLDGVGADHEAAKVPRSVGPGPTQQSDHEVLMMWADVILRS